MWGLFLARGRFGGYRGAGMAGFGVTAGERVGGSRIGGWGGRIGAGDRKIRDYSRIRGWGWQDLGLWYN